MTAMSALPTHQPNSPDSAGLSGRQWIMLVTLSLSLAIVIIDASIVNVTIPAISNEFHASIPDLQWISASYALVYAALLITFGRLSDTLGRRLVFILGIATFGVGSILVGVAGGVGVILVGRVIQGIGAAMASPSTLSILSVSFTGKSRGIAFGIWGATAGAGGALGPLLGGFFTTNFNWRWAFLVNIPIAAIAILGGLLLITESKDEEHRHTLDFGGIVLASVGFAAIVLGFIEAPTYGWITPSGTAFTIGGFTWATNAVVSLSLVAFVAGVVFLTVFVVYARVLARRGKEPLFDFRLLRYGGFRFGLLTVCVVALGEFGILFILSLYLQEVRGLSAVSTGLLLLPFAGGAFVTAPIAGILSSRVGPKWVISVGMLLEALAIFLISRVVQVDTPLGIFIPIFTLYGIGLGLAIAQLTNVVLSNIPSQFAGTGSGANNTLRQVGAAIGVAILGAVLSSQVAAVSTSRLNQSTTIPTALKPTIQQLIDRGQPKEVIVAVVGNIVRGINSRQPQGAPDSPSKGVPALDEAAITRATGAILDDAETQGTRDAGIFAALFVLLGAASSLLIPNPERRDDRDAYRDVAYTLFGNIGDMRECRR
jgi:EmrB/QacA subfamily drug resistance transporter